MSATTPSITAAALDDLAFEAARVAPPPQGAVSWGAVLAGAAAAASLSLILLVLGTGLGLSSVSPWVNDGLSAEGFGASTIAWITFTSLLASGLGGYIAGRLRTRWTNTRVDEVYFRDTAHGFLAWSIATLATATLLASAVGTVLGGGLKAGASAAGGLAGTAAGTALAASVPAAASAEPDSLGYYIDALVRRDPASALPANARPALTSSAEDANAAVSAELGRIFVTSLQTGELSAADLYYVASVVSQRTGLSQADAEKRVSEIYAAAQTRIDAAKDSARAAADKARKASAAAALWIFISLLSGAFVASLAATFGGRQRDL